MIESEGVYVVPHADGTVAVGSTSEPERSDLVPDARLDALLARARALCPVLGDAPVLARWAGLRPRGPRPDPMLGPLPGLRGVYVATGGFRIGFGIAYAVSAFMADMVCGSMPILPPGFSLAEHLTAARALRH